MFPKLILILGLCFFSKLMMAQTETLFNQILQEKIVTNQTSKKQNQPNKLLNLYKNYISSQDGNSCNFYPSCSQYANISIRQYGLLIGLLRAFDRLSRCNAHNHQFYIFFNNSNKQLDK